MKKLLLFGIVFSCIWLMYQFPHAMLNPGDLADVHLKINHDCMACHEPFSGISNEKCILCHKLSEIGKKSEMTAGKDTAGKILFHQNLTTQKCSDCHTEHKGMKADISIRFSHQILSPNELNNCISCHVKPENNLHKQISDDCQSCHNTNGWKSGVLFNHGKIISGDNNNCSSCHKKPEDTFHKQVKDECGKCHTNDKWKPSTFDHSEYFIFDKHHPDECNKCHTSNNYKSYTCYNCHEHSESKIREKHIEEGISNYTDCARCHKSGNEHDIRMKENGNQELNQGKIKDIKDRVKSEDKKNKKDHEEEND